MKKRFLTLVAGMAFCSMNAFAQEAEVAVIEETEVEETSSGELSISGSIDTYYRTVLNADPLNNDEDSDDYGSVQAPGSSFANGNGFAIGMANIILEKSGEKTGFVADLVFGPRGADAVFGSQYELDNGDLISGNSTIVNQLYAYWNVSDAVTLTLGNFNTFLGYEVISPAGNFNYSTSYMFSYGPFSHTGLKADFALSDEFSAMLAVMNPTDLTEMNPQTDVFLGAQVGYTPEAGGAWLNVVYGHSQAWITGPTSLEEENWGPGTTFQIDLTTGWDLSEELYLGLNATTQTFTPDAEFEVDLDNPSFSGAALYLQYAFSDMFALGVRGEYFTETYGLAGVTIPDDENRGDVIDLTLSGNIYLGDLTLIPEIRADILAEPDGFEGGVWTTEGGTGEGTNTLISAMLAAVYSF